MWHLKTIRKNSGQTPAKLRARLRKAEKVAKELGHKVTALEYENTHLRNIPPQKLPIPDGFSDMLISRLGEYLARGLAEKVSKEVPELKDSAHMASRAMAEVLAGNFSYNVRPYGEIQYIVEQGIREEDVKFTLSLHNIDVCFTEDLRIMEMRTPYTRMDTMKAPKRIHVTNQDFHARA